jgi:molybdenum cofactor cytidylyltransferase
MISAIVLAAGLSTRMGRPKMTLPWGQTTVIGQVVNSLQSAGLEEIIVVTGGARGEVESAVRQLPARAVFNPRFAEGEMLLSLQVGLAALAYPCEAALVALGDQPQMENRIVRGILAVYHEFSSGFVVPSYQMRRGHPWIVARPLWDSILALQPPVTLKDILESHKEQIHYWVVDSPSVIQDLDTPDEYQRYQPKEKLFKCKP